MSRPTSLSSAISLLAMATMLAGCATPQRSAIREVKPVGEVGLATRAMAALNSGDIAQAIDLAERAVAKTPDDAGFRGLLGNAYFAGGRFASAEAAYKDSLTLYSNQPQVALKLALVEIAQGKTVEAVDLLGAAGDLINPADYGLALALAGRQRDAIDILQAAARQPGADARVRQNLALAYALSREWNEARTIAAQDVPANQLDARIQQWMQFASPRKASDQVASMIGVTPAAVDPGQPVRLALNKTNTRMVQAAPAPVQQRPAVQPQPQVAFAAPAPAPQSLLVRPTPQLLPQVAIAPPMPAPQPLLAEVALPLASPAARLQAIEAPIAPVPQFTEVVAPPAPAPAPKARPVVAEAASPAPVTMALMVAASKARDAVESLFVAKPAPVAKLAKPRRVAAVATRPALRATSGAVVQIGAYGSPQRVTAGWTHLTARYPALRAYLPMRAKFVSPKGTFWRLSITGFANQREAIARCKLLKSRGGACFVRNFAGDAPVQYASR